MDGKEPTESPILGIPFVTYSKQSKRLARGWIHFAGRTRVGQEAKTKRASPPKQSNDVRNFYLIGGFLDTFLDLCFFSAKNQILCSKMSNQRISKYDFYTSLLGIRASRAVPIDVSFIIPFRLSKQNFGSSIRFTILIGGEKILS